MSIYYLIFSRKINDFFPFHPAQKYKFMRIIFTFCLPHLIPPCTDDRTNMGRAS